MAVRVLEGRRACDARPEGSGDALSPPLPAKALRVLLDWVGVAMKLVLALAGALLLSLICEKADAQVAREAFYSIPSETVSAADFLTGKKGTPIALAGQLRFAKTGYATGPVVVAGAKQPLVILLHSAAGPVAEGAPYEEWPRVLNEVGTARPGGDPSPVEVTQLAASAHVGIGRFCCKSHLPSTSNTDSVSAPR